MIPKEFLAEQLELFGIPQPSEVVEKLDLFSDLHEEKNKVTMQSVPGDRSVPC